MLVRLLDNELDDVRHESGPIPNSHGNFIRPKVTAMHLENSGRHGPRSRYEDGGLGNKWPLNVGKTSEQIYGDPFSHSRERKLHRYRVAENQVALDPCNAAKVQGLRHLRTMPR